MADSINGGSGGSSTSDLGDLLRQSPFGPLLELVDEKTLIEAFANSAGSGGGGNPFGNGGEQPDLSYGGNPFAGDNFWNVFAGGQNPTKVTENQGGGNPFGGSGGNPFGGGSGSKPSAGANDNPFPVESLGSGSDNPFGGGSGNPFGGGSGNPFA